MAFERATTLAWTQAQMQLHHLGISVDEAHLFQRLANHMLYSDPSLRPGADVISAGLRKSSTLWAQGISGICRIVLVRIEEDDDLELVRQLLRAHEYWRLKQLAVDLVILNERPHFVRSGSPERDRGLVRMNQSMPKIASDSTRGSVFVCVPICCLRMFALCCIAAARAVLHGDRGALAEQINRARERMPAKAPPPKRVRVGCGTEGRSSRGRRWNSSTGLGGFTKEGREYLTILNGTESTPAPWINVISNPTFGFQVSTEGGWLHLVDQ